MIKPEDLRIGNYYNWEAEGKDYLYKIEPKDFANDNYKNFKPIPLTEEWHNKFGVQYKNAISNYVYKLPSGKGFNNFNIRVVFSSDYVWIKQQGVTPREDDIISIWNKDLTKRDMFVHEWQNLYHALTGKELIKKS